MERDIYLEQKNNVGYIIIDWPKANSYEINFMQQLIACLGEAENSDQIKVIVLKSALDKFFSAGADIKVFQTNTVADNKVLVQHARKAAKKLSNSNKISIAAINGHALGGGLELAMACDIRLGSDGEYLLGLPEIKLGLIPGNGGSQRLIRLINKTKALELLLTGDTFDGKEAFDLGLFSHLYPVAKFNAAVTAYAEKLAQGPFEAMSAIKLCVNQGGELPLKEGLALEDDLVNGLYDTDDAKEGLKAFVEKRTARFK
jgi:enoyl-CoA hydratase/carnithine racemase